MSRRINLMGLAGLLAMAGAYTARAGDIHPPRPVGLIAIQGSVWVDRLPASPSMAVFEGDTVTTDGNSAAIVQFRSGVTAALSGTGEMVLSRASRGERLDLRKGVLSLRNAGLEPAQVRVVGASVLVKGRDGLPAACRITAMGSGASVFAEKGQVEIRGSGARAPILLAQGKMARLEAGGRPAAPQAVQKAGTVSAAIPAETVQRQGQGTAVPLKVRDDVNWQDVVQTLDTGRVRISLQDGSLLNVGARSQMRIVQHDPQSQQTQVELTLGKMRSQVIKLTKPGASFEVKTQTAVIGVVGTTFVVLADRAQTQVFCIEGQVSVQNVNPAISGQVRLNPGQSSTVTAGAAPSAAAATSAAQIQAQMDLTDVGPPTTAGGTPTTGEGGPGTTSGPGAGGTAGAGGTSGGIGSTLSITTAGVAAAGGAAAVSGVLATSKADDAAGALSGANSALEDANAAANAATAAINANQPPLSPSTPCGCGT